MSSRRGPTDERINDLLTVPRPISLSDLERGDLPVTTAPEPIPVGAWVRFPESPVFVHGRAVEWTDRAVRVEWTTASGRNYSAWVWASAVKRGG